MLIDQNGCPRITDFGLSSIRNTYVATVGASDRPTNAGTPRFQAPELINPENYTLDGRPDSRYTKGHPTTRSDIYALAMTCVQMFTCAVPFGSLRDSQITYAVVHQNLRPERPENIPELVDSLWELLVKCWAPHPNDRPNMVDVIDSLVSNSPIPVIMITQH